MQHAFGTLLSLPLLLLQLHLPLLLLQLFLELQLLV
jgi:hypothetical protein